MSGIGSAINEENLSEVQKEKLQYLKSLDSVCEDLMQTHGELVSIVRDAMTQCVGECTIEIAEDLANQKANQNLFGRDVGLLSVALNDLYKAFSSVEQAMVDVKKTYSLNSKK